MPFAISFFGLVLGSLAIGVYAQQSKGRTGAGWAALTFILGVVWALVLWLAYRFEGAEAYTGLMAAWAGLKEVEASLWGPPVFTSMLATVIYAGPPYVLMLIAVWSLPNHLSRSPQSLEMATLGAAQVLGQDHPATIALARAASTKSKADRLQAKFELKRLRRDQRQAVAEAAEV